MSEMPMPVPQSFLMWVITTLGINTLLLPLCALVSFLLTLLLVLRGKGPLTGIALLFIVPAPLLWGCFAALKASIASFSVLALSDSSPPPSAIVAGVAEALLLPLAGLMTMVPSYLTAVIGLVVRSFQGPDR
jgi:hypothetical protein